MFARLMVWPSHEGEASLGIGAARPKKTVSSNALTAIAPRLISKPLEPGPLGLKLASAGIFPTSTGIRTDSIGYGA